MDSWYFVIVFACWCAKCIKTVIILRSGFMAPLDSIYIVSYHSLHLPSVTISIQDIRK